jgi:prephenate dehydrogenase
MQTVAIVGVGLIGGSFGLALQRTGFRGEILGVSSEPAISEGLRCGAIHRAATLPEAAAQADLLFLSQPIRGILKTIQSLSGALKPGALVTDAGSTKSRIVAQAASSLPPRSFLGGHPMAGKATRGASEGDASLFTNRPWLLTPESADHLSDAPAAWLLDVIRAVGAVPLILSPSEHDRLVAASSHLPQLLSTALAAALDARTDEVSVRACAGPGLHDTTRLALSNYDVWADILATNTAEIAAALDIYLAELQSIRARLDDPSMKDTFERAARFAAALRNA